MLKHIKIADVSTKQLVINGHERGALTHLLEAKIMGDDWTNPHNSRQLIQPNQISIGKIVVFVCFYL